MIQNIQKRFITIIMFLAMVIGIPLTMTHSAYAADYDVIINHNAIVGTRCHITAFEIYGARSTNTDAMLGFTRPIKQGTTNVYGDIADTETGPFIGVDGVDFGRDWYYGQINGLLLFQFQDYYFYANTAGIYTFTAFYCDDFAGIDDKYNVTITVSPADIAAPTVTGISPSSGPTAGGTSVTITGTNLTGATAVKFGSTNATSYTVNSATQITATAPAGSGTVDITVTTAGRTSATSAADNFTYVVAPTAVTSAATSVSSTGATLNGTINANNASTAVTFEYGTTTGYGTSVTATQSPATGSSTTSVSYTLSGLTPGTTYHYRVKGINSGGTTNGDDMTFTTLADVPAGPGGWVADWDIFYGLDYDTTKDGTNPSIVDYNGVLYAAWSEGDYNGIHQLRLKRFDASANTWISVDGGGTTGINYNTNISSGWNFKPSLAVFNNELYVAWMEQASSSGWGLKIHIKKYNSTTGIWSWVDGGTEKGLCVTSTMSVSVQNPYLAIYNDKLYVTWHEDDKVYLAQYSGTGSVWSVKGGALNSYGSGYNPVLTVSNGLLYIAWYEYQSGPFRIHVKSYNSTGDVFTFVDGGTNGINKDSAGNAQNVSLQDYNGTLFAAWCERNTAGSSIGQVRVAKYNGGTSWTFVDGNSSSKGINYNSAMEAFNSKMAFYNNELYVLWDELNTYPNTRKVHAKKYNKDTDTWSSAEANGITSGGAAYGLNADLELYDASNPAIGLFDGSLYAAWEETNRSLKKSIKVKKFDPTFSTTQNAADLSNLSVSQGLLNTLFDPGTKYYYVLLDNSVSTISITPTKAKVAATIKINGITVTSGQAYQISLDVGDNNIIISVISDRGAIIKDYFLRINRAVSGNVRRIGANLDAYVDDYGSYPGGDTTSIPGKSVNFVGCVAQDSMLEDSRAALKFDTSIINNAILSAKLYIHIEDNGSIIGPVWGYTMDANPVVNVYGSNNDSWGPQTYPGTLLTTDVSIDAASKVVSAIGSWMSFDANVNSFFDNQIIGNKIASYVITGGTTGNKVFGFNSASDTNVPSLKPYIEVEYIPAPVATGAVLSGDHKQVTLTFNQAVSNALADINTLKSNVYLSTDGNTFSPLEVSDTISFNSGNLVVTFNSALTGSTNKIKVLAGSLKGPSDNVKREDSITAAIDASGSIVTTCTVTFDSEGGTVSPTTQAKKVGSTYGKASDGTTDEALPVPTKTGASFGGWYVGDNGTGNLVSATTTVTNASNHTLYAKWIVLALNAVPNNTDNYIALNWTNSDTSQTYHYMVTKKDTSVSGATAQTIPLKSSGIKVLNIFPGDGTGSQGDAALDVSASLKKWMETDTFGGVAFGKGLITVDRVYIDTFDANPGSYLIKDGNGNYNYDIVFIGAADSNNSKGISLATKNAIQAFIDAGGGYLAGHDTADGVYSDPELVALADNNINMISGAGYGLYGNSNTNSQLQVVKKGMLTNYPWTLSGTTLTVPASHTSNQFAKGDIWMKYTTNQFSSTEQTTAEGTNNFYLTSWNNCAQIQTGHINGQATDDEKKVLANTLMYLAQVTSGTSFDDHTAQDVTAPGNVTTAQVSVGADNKATVTITNPTDNGNNYEYKLKAIGMTDNKTYWSDTVSKTITSGIKGYYIVIDKNATIASGSTITQAYSAGETTTYTSAALAGGQWYAHILAVDNAGNVSASFKDVSFTVKADITGITFVNSSVTYDGTEKTISITGTLPDGTSISYSGNKGTTAGTYNATATITGGANYKDLTLNAALTINKAVLTATVENNSKIYGEANPTFAVTVTGFKNGETAATAAGYTAPTASSTATATTNVGTADITISGGAATNYSFDITDTATLTINKALLTATVADSSRAYGETNPTFAVTVTGFKNGETAATAAGYTAPTASSTATAMTNVGTADITISGGVATNYSFDITDTATLTINKAVLTATVENSSRAYGETNPVFTVTVTGFKNGETAATAAGYTAPTAGSIATATTNVGTVAITISGGAADNYSFDVTDTATLTINKAVLTATVEDNSKIYGEANPTFAVTVTGFKNGETIATAAGYTAPTASSTATVTTNAGTAPITISSGAADNYSFDVTDTATLTINKALLTATVADSSRAYGETNPAFTVTVTGFKNGETAATAAGYTAPTASSTATATTNVGTADITISGGAATNYSFDTTDTATLTINKAVLTATVENNSKTYGEANPTFAVTVTGFKNGETAATAAGYTAPTAGSIATATTNVGTVAITISGGAADNYSFDVTDTATLTINKAVLTATVEDSSKIYGEANPTFAVTVTGFKNGETAATAAGYTAPTASSTATATTNVGTAPITISGGAADNYSFDVTDTATLTINKALLTATVADSSRAYGETNPAFTVTVTGFKNGETAATAAGYTAPTASSTATATTNVGTADITISGGAATNYSFDTTDTATLTINKAVLTATVEDSSKTYGEANPTFAVTVTGFKNGETAATAAGYAAPTASSTATATTNVGTADITISGGAATNYSFDITDTATLTINKAVLTATVENNSKTYGEANPTFAVTVTGFKNGETEATAAGYIAPTASSTATATTAAGTADITISGGAADNYSFDVTDIATLTINKAVLTATVENNSKTYGEANPTFAVTVTGFKNGETAATAAGYTAPTASSIATATTNVGTVAITISGGAATNYSFDITDTATLTINKAVLTATVENNSKTYGEANPTFAVTVTGFKNGETAATAAGYTAPTASSTATATTNVGTADITISGGAADNYSFDTTDTATLTINKALLTATVENSSRAYGETNPAFTVTVTGFKNGETAATAAGYTAPTASSTATATTNVGTADITISGGAATNYSFDTTDTATLTINKAVLTATVENNSKTYGEANPTFAVTVTGFKNGETAATAAGYTAPTAGSIATATTNVGTVAITISGGAADNYSFDVTDTATLTINKAVLTATVEDNSKIYGEANPTFAVTVTGFKNGETIATAAGYTAPTANSTATATTNVGTAPITISGGAADNYSFDITDTATLTINKALLTATVADSSRAYGETNPVFTVTVTGFKNGETAATAAGYTAPTASSTATATTNVGTADITISGGAATNYSFDITDTATLTINKAVLTATVEDASKTYGEANPAFNVTVTGFKNGETETTAAGYTAPTASSTATATTAAGTADITISGGAADNYSFDVTDIATLTINKKALTATATVIDKFFDNTNAATGTIILTGIVGTDAVTASGTFAFASVDIGTGITVNVTGITLAGTDAGNYTVNETATTTANIIKKSSGAGGQSEQGQGNTGIDISVNDKTGPGATGDTKEIDGKKVTTISVDDQKMEEKLEQEGNNSVVTISVNNNSDIITSVLTGQTVRNMESKEAVLEIKTQNVTYTLPAAQINIDNVSEQIGQEVQLKDIKVNVTVSSPPEDTVKIVQDTANKNNYQIVVKPVEFNITCTSGNKTVEVSKFNGYVERMIAIPEGIDPSKITTGIILNNDGTFSHVPTQIVAIDGKYYAKINSLTNSTYSVIYSPKTFRDVELHWAKDYVNNMASRLVINGIDSQTFAPDRDITRAEFAAIIVRALGLTETDKSIKFSDVKTSDWFVGSVAKASEYGIVQGMGDGTFMPSKSISREEAMAMIARAMKITGMDTASSETDTASILSQYKDSSSVSAWAKNAAATCTSFKVMQGSYGNLRPQSNITRAETAAVVMRMLQQAELINK